MENNNENGTNAPLTFEDAAESAQASLFNEPAAEESGAEPIANNGTNTAPSVDNTAIAAQTAKNSNDQATAQPSNQVEQDNRQLSELIRAIQQNNELQKENQQLKQQLEEAANAAKEQSEASKQDIENTMMEPPKLDLSDFAYLSDEERERREQDFSVKMRDYTLGEVNRKMQPIIEQYDKQQRAAQRDAAIVTLKDKFSDLESYMPQMDALMASDNAIAKALSQASPREQMAAAYLIVKGIQSTGPRTEPTTEELVNTISSNPDAMRMLELRRNEQIRNNSNVPPQAASSGVANIPAQPKQQPKNFDEAQTLALKALGI